MLGIQLDLFKKDDISQKEQKLQEVLLNVKNKFGKNALLRGISFEKKATARVRNKLIGGHNSE